MIWLQNRVSRAYWSRITRIATFIPGRKLCLTVQYFSDSVIFPTLPLLAACLPSLHSKTIEARCGLEMGWSNKRGYWSVQEILGKSINQQLILGKPSDMYRFFSVGPNEPQRFAKLRERGFRVPRLDETGWSGGRIFLMRGFSYYQLPPRISKILGWIRSTR